MLARPLAAQARLSLRLQASVAPLGSAFLPRTMASSASSGAERPVVLCGPSGVGKSTLIKRLFVDHPEFGFSVSHTTRKPRPGETDGVSYHFVSRDEFLAAVERGEFLEHAEFGGNCYGTTAKAVQDVQQGQAGKNRALLDIDTQGVKLIKANHAYLAPLFVFIAPPRLSVLRERLQGRGTETPDSLAKRLAMAGGELAYARQAGNYDAIIVNDDLERAYAKLKAAVEGEAVPHDELPPVEDEERQAA